MNGLGDHQVQQKKHENEQWLTWWKLAVVTVGSGVVLVITAVITEADPTYILVLASACALLAIGFLVVELRTNAPNPRLVIREDGPKPTRWRWKSNVALLLAIASIIASLGKAGAEIWKASQGSQVSAAKESALQPSIVNNNTNICRARLPRHRVCKLRHC